MGWRNEFFKHLSVLHVLAPFSSDISLQVTGLVPRTDTAVGRPHCCMWSFILLPEESLKSFKKKSKDLGLASGCLRRQRKRCILSRSEQQNHCI